MKRFLSAPGRLFAFIAGALLLLRIATLVVSDINLGPDEGQYWFWAQSLSFGYFSKPPLIAWSIAATTALFGDSEWAVRLAAPLYQTGAACFLYFLARRIAGPREALWAGLAWLTLPGVFLSSMLITTDAPLIFFWSGALYFFFRASDPHEDDHRRRWTIMLGVAIGLGFLSKYAMSYFLVGAGFALALSAERRRAFGPLNPVIAIAIAAAILAPNVWWNAQNDFQTLTHTAANADWGRSFGHPGELADFFGDQFAIAGPIMLALVFLAVLFARRDLARKADMQTLLAMSLPPLIIVALQAFISRAHGNWAAVAYPSAIIMTIVWALNDKRAFLALKVSLAIHIAVGLGLLLAFADSGFAGAVGADAAMKRLRGWDRIGAQIETQSANADAIMTDDREVAGELVYYARKGERLVAWNSNGKIDSHFEAFNAFDPNRDRRVLYVTSYADALLIKERFETIEPIGEASAPIGKNRTRTLYLFSVSGFIGE
ncbi:MAG: glycosyltransferase family 39 protein [Parvularculaceae bacterium]|nr:glycosyltransferase family 39 protein [Parvularculaceae bacterium]